MAVVLSRLSSFVELAYLVAMLAKDRLVLVSSTLPTLYHLCCMSSLPTVSYSPPRTPVFVG